MSLYLKYRPNDFENLMWQSFVKETLQKAIAQDKTVWAYLLCWPRWTWKTTTARLIAKTINCMDSKDWNPCNNCEICKDFSEDRLVDIIEIDAASHTWVDNIREIIERAQFTPNKTKYKVYIIDEVHMLSKWAFNALLKILEEPPTHVKFILATTETNKLPETIISRCQRYDFKRINNNDIKTRLEYISKKEWINVDDKSYDYIISNSAWWLRNAISLYEQMIVDGKINYEHIIDKLWIIDHDQLDNILNKLLTNDSNSLDDINQLIDNWKNLKLFIKDLIFYTKDIIFKKIISWDDVKKYIFILDTLNKSYSESKNSLDENITLMIGIYKILSWFTDSDFTLNSDINFNNANIISDNKSNNKDEEFIKKDKHLLNNSPELKEDKINTTEINVDDIDDIFWNDIVDNQINSEVNDLTSDKNTSWKDDFNLELFISNLKLKWAKWALTMALRWSSISLEKEKLNIKPNNSFTKKTLQNVDSLALMKWILNEMWFNSVDVDIL